MTSTRKFVVLSAALAVIGPALMPGPASAGFSGTTVTVQNPAIEFVLGDSHEIDFDMSASDGTLDPVDGYYTYKRYNQDLPQGSNGTRFDYDRSGPSASVTEVLTMGAGWTGCFFLTYADKLPCFGTPVDDTKLVAGGKWKRSISQGSYWNTISTSKVKGDTLKLKDARYTHLAIVVTKCPGCGTIMITQNGVELDVVSLEAASVKKKQLLQYEISSGAHVISTIGVKITSKDKPVRIDGIGVIDRDVIV